LAHVSNDRFDTTQGAEVIGLHDGTEFGEGKLFNGSIPFNACVVDQDIDVASLFVDCFDARLHRSVGVDVHGRDIDGQVFRRGMLRELRACEGLRIVA
jgi:hypothetical protein